VARRWGWYRGQAGEEKDKPEREGHVEENFAGQDSL